MENCKNNKKLDVNKIEVTLDEKETYMEFLKQENEQLRNQLKVTEEDRDQAKQDVQKMVAKYLELYAENNDRTFEDVAQEFGEEMHKILER